MKLTTVEAAKKLGVTDGAVRERCQSGTLRAEKISNKYHPDGGVWTIDSKDLADHTEKLKQPKCKSLAEVDKAYIAGLLDGEGCFTAFITQIRRHPYIHWLTIYFIQIIVVEEQPIRWLKDVTGLGYVFQRKRQKQEYQDLWGWRVQSGPACEIVEQIMPYLKIKHRHAEIFLELRQRVLAIKNYRKGRGKGNPMPEEEYLQRQKLIDEIHRLNKPTGKVLRKEYSAKGTEVNPQGNPDRPGTNAKASYPAR